MQRLRSILTAAVVAFAAELPAVEEAADRAVAVTLELADGSRLVGKPAFNSLALRTSYAQLDLPIEQIGSMQMGKDGETVSAVLRSGDRLNGVPGAEFLALQTVFGPVRVAIAHVRSVTVKVRAPASADAADGPAADADPNNVAVNGGFETGRPETRWPTRAGVWSGSISAMVTAERGIRPRSGERMLRFDTTSWGAPGDGQVSRVVQIVDMSGYRDAMKAGKVRVAASAWFNRVTGDAATDRRMQLGLVCYRGEHARNFDSLEQGRYLAAASSRVDTDGDVSTWERATTEVRVPAETDYVMVDVAAIEDVRNDLDGQEFDGHYADDVNVRVLIEE